VNLLEQHIDFKQIKALIIASPGFVKEEFYKFLRQEVEKYPRLKQFKHNQDKFLLIHSANGYTNCLSEILSDPHVLKSLSNTKAIRQIRIMNDFFEMLEKDYERVTFGAK